MNTSTSIYDSFISLDNLKLAWDRVRYCDRSDSRDWIGLKVFAANRDHNLELLRQTLTGRTFEASYLEIKYLPKASRRLRCRDSLCSTQRKAIAQSRASKDFS
ncbi:hypothetical protein H6G97_25165 [Nostoc flagelliforme FACHB-838]|uniref:Transposase n=1 Tax=Nostoc flagelliforme FACHB-838 TaxID=2692904 RepID=A0ABR8DTD3_9NOSO|nr:hypothetical protein [Nostoc flagelliforme]MBD2532696.1 hypothetical protein [Nostoc flagelliforme FACHB-838]